MYIFGFLIALGLVCISSAQVCDMHAYCRQVGGALSYCKDWQTVSTCFNADKFTNCAKCGVSTTATTTLKATTVAGSTTKASTIATTTTRATTVVTTTRASSTISSSVSTTRGETTSTTRAGSATCDRHAYCRQVGGPLSYCKDWLAVSSCHTADQFTNCISCGSTGTSATTTIKATTAVTTIVATTAKPSTTSAAPTTTRAPTTAGSATCDRHAYCRQVGGPLSYCKDWLAVSSCHTADQFTNCITCGSNGVTASTTIKPTTTAAGTVATTTRATTVATTIVTTTRITTVGSTTAAVPVMTTATSSSSSECESLPLTQIPLFLWAEMPSIKTRLEFVAFYQRLGVFLNANCVNMRTTTLVVRVVHPKYPTATDPMFWPPSSSPLFTELISKISVKSGNKIKILLYPYVMEDYDRAEWVRFGHSMKATPLVNNQMSVYDGVFAFTKAWQDFVASSTSFTIDGFMIDYEEISKRMGTQYLFDFTTATVGPYKTAFPTIKLGTSVGYDDAGKIKNFDPFVDYFHLQVYDFFYPYPLADKSATDSIFEVYKDDPSGFLSTVLANVLTPTVLKAYAGRESKIKLMWSTQTMSIRNCLYPLRDGSCGINYEFAWNPSKFNQFVQIMLATPQLGPFEHGIYTYNFMRQDWVVKSQRSR